ncbi:MAG TPA: branched-chain amino acid aminotransferase, partial [Planctomycetaceae bacterium]|nr:branched-chain amino acid aminotransferase [Planctomycetaceae bacterium]
MTQLINNLYNDEAGFIVSAELVLVATIAVLGMVVGLS